MKKQPSFSLAILGYILPIIVLSYLYFNSKALIPAGYDLAIDGYVISKNLVLICNLYFISKLGIFLHEYIESNRVGGSD